MSTPWQTFEMGESALGNLTKMVREKERIFNFVEDPQLASLVCCLGIRYELGDPGSDRISHLLGIDIQKHQWKSEIIQLEGELGIRLWLEGQCLAPQAEDLFVFLHPLSLNNKNITQMIIFPTQIAKHYQSLGLELVIVRDWALTSFLCEDESERVNYVKTSVAEIRMNSAMTQVELMAKHQQPFMGTHDIGDHLLGGSLLGRSPNHHYIEKAWAVMSEVFSYKEAKNSQLLVSYLIGVILDDMAQPKWFGTDAHPVLLNKSLDLLELLSDCPNQKEALEITDSFHEIVRLLRTKPDNFARLIDGYFGVFTLEVLGEETPIPNSSAHHI